MNENTNNPAPVVAQQKTLDEKIDEAQALERQLWQTTETTAAALKPHQDAYNEACRNWSNANRKLEVLVAIKKEMAQ